MIISDKLKHEQLTYFINIKYYVILYYIIINNYNKYLSKTNFSVELC